MNPKHSAANCYGQLFLYSAHAHVKCDHVKCFAPVIPCIHINSAWSKLIFRLWIDYCMQYWYGFRCNFHEEFISLIICFIFSLQKILKNSVSEFKNVNCVLGNCQLFNPTEFPKVTAVWPMVWNGKPYHWSMEISLCVKTGVWDPKQIVHCSWSQVSGRTLYWERINVIRRSDESMYITYGFTMGYQNN